RDHIVASPLADIRNAFDQGHEVLDMVSMADADGTRVNPQFLPSQPLNNHDSSSTSQHPGRVIRPHCRCYNARVLSDPQPGDAAHTQDGESDASRDAKIEQLLLGGLDHYFAGQYDQAINVWTRAFFFDRGHARARAYIERARSALAERQRQSEELLQTGVAAFHRGDGDEARRLLQAAIDAGAPPEDALAFLERLNRLESVRTKPSRSFRGVRPFSLRAERAAASRPLRWAVGVASLVIVGLGGA